jgi:hypothetical protein
MVSVQAMIFKTASYQSRVFNLALNFSQLNNLRLRRDIFLESLRLEIAKIMTDHEAAAE